MKTYFEPKMSIAAFDNADVITTSGGGFDKNVVSDPDSTHAFVSTTYKDLNELTQFNADSQVNN